MATNFPERRNNLMKISPIKMGQFAGGLLAMILLMLVPAAQAESQSEPLNVMIEDVTFPRPAGWKWAAPPTNLSVVNQFVISKEDGEIAVRVLFCLANQNSESLGRAWKGWMKEADQPENVQEERVKIGGREVYFLTMHGTFTKSRKAQPDFGFIGVVLPARGHFIQIRMEGPQAEVKKAAGDFRKMIEEALKEG
jgi:hypothetical protein